MTDSKCITPAADALVIKVVAGTGAVGSQDGPLRGCQFNQPRGLCRFGDSLLVADAANCTIREVSGVLGVDNPISESGDSVSTAADFEARAVPLIMTAISQVPKE